MLNGIQSSGHKTPGELPLNQKTTGEQPMYLPSTHHSPVICTAEQKISGKLPVDQKISNGIDSAKRKTPGELSLDQKISAAQKQTPDGPPIDQQIPILDNLSMIEQFQMEQKVDPMEVVTLLVSLTNNRYEVSDSLGKRLYTAEEVTDFWTRFWFGYTRSFNIKLRDNLDKEVIHFKRPLKCTWPGTCCFPNWLQNLEVSSPPGTIIGTVEQEWTFWKAKFRICDQDGNVVLKILGPSITSNVCRNNIEFKVTLPDEKTGVGLITRDSLGLVEDIFTDADYFSINFPVDLDVRCKAILIGAAMLIDFMFYEV